MTDDRPSPSSMHPAAELAIGDHHVAYTELGAGDPILFLHGNPGSSYIWRNVLPQLEDQGRCIAVDLVGLGRSSKPEEPLRFHGHLEVLRSVVDALGLDGIRVVAHDWGTALAFALCAADESRYRSLALVEPLLFPTDLTWTDLRWNEPFRAIREPETAGDVDRHRSFFLETVLPALTQRPMEPEVAQAYARPFLPPDGSAATMLQWARDLPVDGEPADVLAAVRANREWLATSDVPKAILAADPGSNCPPALLPWVEANVRNVTITEVADAGHYVQEDAPDAVVAWLRDWLERHR